MSKVPMPADGGGTHKGAPDGVGSVGSRGEGGESGGGSYSDKDQVKATGQWSDPMGHGGQSENTYHGGGDAPGGKDGEENPNAGAKPGS